MYNQRMAGYIFLYWLKLIWWIPELKTIIYSISKLIKIILIEYKLVILLIVYTKSKN